MSVEKISRDLNEQLQGGTIEEPLVKRQKLVELWLKIFGWSFASIILGSVSIGIIYGLIIKKGQVLRGVLFLLFLLSLVGFALLAAYRESLIKASRSRENSRMLSARDTGELAESSAQHLPGITEGTTELMEPVPAELTTDRSTSRVPISSKEKL